ncbi:MAG: antitoxin VapB family protein [Candidatus Lokiarchaeota archaeon]|nr:antitoxin VapB family protein [Candidatus Lokiarchaeota archaeon]
MTQKTLSLPVEVYERLRHMKSQDESYGDLVMRLINEHEKKAQGMPIESFAGALSEEDSDDWGDIEKILYQKRFFSENRAVRLDDK